MRKRNWMRTVIVLAVATAVWMFISPRAHAQGQELIDRNFSGISKMKTPNEARRDIQDQAARQVTEEIARDLLGAEKFQKNQSVIMGKVIRSWTRYIPLMKQGNLASGTDGFTATLTMKVNPEIFRQVLQENGLLNETAVTPMVLPLFAIVDEVAGKTDRWWMDSEAVNSPQQRAMARQFEETLRPAMRKQGFYLIRPLDSKAGVGIPSALRMDRPAPEDLPSFSEWFSAPLVMMGQVVIARMPNTRDRYRLDLRATVYQSGLSRELVDIVRTAETEAGRPEFVIPKRWTALMNDVSEDLSTQLEEASRRGQVGSRQIKLSINQKLRLQDVEKFKEKLRLSRAGIRQIHERMLSLQQTAFEIDVPLPAKDLAQRLEGFEFDGKRWNAEVVNENEVRMVQQ